LCLLPLLLASGRCDVVDGKRRSRSLSIPQRLAAGGASRFGAQLVTYPADAMRTLAQTRTGAKTLAELGVGTLISGCVTTSCFAFLVGAIQFSIFGTLQHSLGALGASTVGALGSCLASVPQEVIKQRLVTGIYPNFAAAVQTIYATEGIRGFYAAWLPTVSRNVPFVAITFTSFAALQRRRLRERGTEGEGAAGSSERGGSLTTLESLAVGVASALIGGLCTQPIDVVKTRMMTQAAASGALPYAGAIDCVRTMLAQEGVGVFFAGIGQRSLYMGPLWAIQFALNTQMTRAMMRHNDEHNDDGDGNDTPERQS